MAHPIYNRQQLLNRGMVKVKSVAADLGVIPTGDKRLIQSWVDAIVEQQSTQVQEIEVVEATIDFDGDCYEGLTEPYVVLVNRVVVHRTATYQQAVRHCKWQGYTLLDSQTLAQQELEVELEVQAATVAERSAPVEVLEQAETECKHQIAVKNEIASQVTFISSDDFFNFEAILDGDIHHVIATINFDGEEWVVTTPDNSFSLDSYQKAEQVIKDKYVGDVFMNGRGSGRITQPIEDMGMTIEDSNFVHHFGQSYILRVHGVFAGYIWLNDDHGWTLNGKNYQDDWRPVAKELAKLTRRDLVAA